jgi:hypothetical protein
LDKLLIFIEQAALIGQRSVRLVSDLAIKR